MYRTNNLFSLINDSKGERKRGRGRKEMGKEEEEERKE